ncbi:MAG: SIS domain-containing protein [Gammaproteobacteria bacterium]|nr:SIS domain-containing protein [Gammaproteobacteria bacterium]
MFQTTVNEHLTVISGLQAIEAEINRSAERLIGCLRRGGKILLMGNGGSAADAQHIAAELVVRFEKNRRALAAMALTTDSSILTATSNDFGFEQVFLRQVEALARAEDIVVGISTSGMSENVVRALEVAQQRGVETLGLTGAEGGRVAEWTDQTLQVPSTVTARIQEAHILIGHYWCQRIEEGQQ